MVIPGSAAAQPDTFLSQKVGQLEQADLQRLVKTAGLGKLDQTVLAMLLVEYSGNGTDMSQLTFGNLLDSLNNRKHALDGEMVARHHHGTDSMFIRMPDGSRVFIGLGAMSMERLEERAARDLPVGYDSSRNMLMGDAAAAGRLSELLEADKHSWLTGTVLMLETERGALDTRRVGDVFEIAQRMLAAPELAPFVAEIEADGR